MIYLDNAATTKVSDVVINAMLPYMTNMFGNPSSVHTKGIEAARAVYDARKTIATTIDADPEDIVITSGGSESNAIAILGVAPYLKKIGKTTIITTNVEHQSVLECVKKLSKDGFRIIYLQADARGCIQNIQLQNAFSALEVDESVGLVSIMGVNNEIGNIYPVAQLSETSHKYGSLFHTDYVQAYCNVPLSVKACKYIDFVSVSGHKIHAAKGTGFLYARDKSVLSSIVPGGGQEYGVRSGTENVPGIVGLAAASINSKYQDVIHNAVLKNLLTKTLSENLSDTSGYEINGCGDVKVLSLRFDGIDGETLLLALDALGIEVSAGSACCAHSAVPSHVLKAIGLSDEQARSTIRVSFSDETTEGEVVDAAKVIASVVNQLRCNIGE